MNLMPEIQIPPLLQKGDLISVIAPSGALKEPLALEKGLDIWRKQGYTLQLHEDYQAQNGYLAGTDQQRRQSLLSAWNNPHCKAIVTVRGGYGSMRLLEDWNWNQEMTPKWMIGFSDVTGLLWSLWREKIVGLHAPVLTTLANENDWSLKRLFSFLETGKLEAIEGKGWRKGVAQGRLIPANLTVATHLLNTPVQPNLEGVILALEDVAEAPYRLDRMLTQWRLSGIFTKIKGIALGRFSRCDELRNENTWTVAEMLADRLGDLNIPIISELPFGHDGINACLPVGLTVILDSDQGILSWKNPRSID